MSAARGSSGKKKGRKKAAKKRDFWQLCPIENEREAFDELHEEVSQYFSGRLVMGVTRLISFRYTLDALREGRITPPELLRFMADAPQGGNDAD